MAPDRASIDTMLREAAPEAIAVLQRAIQYGAVTDQSVKAAEALLRCLALLPDPYAAPHSFDLRREVSR